MFIKKIKIMLCLSVVFLLALGAGSMVYGYSSTNAVTLSMTVFNSALVSVTNTMGDIAIGSVLANITNSGGASRTLFLNNGTQREDFSLRGEVISGGLTLVTTQPANNQIRLLPIFGVWNTNYTKTAISADDVISTTYQPCGSSRFARLIDDISVKGTNVAYGDISNNDAQRNLRYFINPGTVTVTGTPVQVRVWVKAAATP